MSLCIYIYLGYPYLYMDISECVCVYVCVCACVCVCSTHFATLQQQLESCKMHVCFFSSRLETASTRAACMFCVLKSVQRDVLCQGLWFAQVCTLLQKGWSILRRPTYGRETAMLPCFLKTSPRMKASSIAIKASLNPNTSARNRRGTTKLWPILFPHLATSGPRTYRMEKLLSMHSNDPGAKEHVWRQRARPRKRSKQEWTCKKLRQFDISWSL